MQRRILVVLIGLIVVPLPAIVTVRSIREPLIRAFEANFMPLEVTPHTPVAGRRALDNLPVVVPVGADTVIAASQWFPALEWRLPNPTWDGNPYDLEATATFRHVETGQTRRTGLYHDGDGEWAFRFTGTAPGHWTYLTSSEDADLDGWSGSVEVTPQPGSPGFVASAGNKWIRTGDDRAFVPQFVMIGGPQTYAGNPAEIDAIVQTFLVEHGFNGVHTPVFCRWFDLDRQSCARQRDGDPDPDRRTFEGLEALITEVYAAGGVVHIWMWGDDSRGENPKRWALNGAADRRLQRYIAARLGPLPGWTMGYGYDLHEWVGGDELISWHQYMHEHFGWPHMLGARASRNRLDQLSGAMDYASYEQHRPDYQRYVATIEARPDRPAFSEDRFRMRDEGRAKDYSMLDTRRGLWRSAMAGGIANIWGNVIDAPGANESLAASAPYPDPDVIATCSRFFEDRFSADLQRCNTLTDGVGLMSPDGKRLIFYAEDAETIDIDLSGMPGAQPAVAVDARLPYSEISIGTVAPARQTWIAPYRSDWAIAVGSMTDR